MKILNIISFGYEGGGAETGVVEINKILKERENEIVNVSSDAGPGKKHFSDYEFKMINANSPFKIFTHLFNLSAYKTFKKVLKIYKPDIVHLHTMGEVSPLALLALRGVPVVMTIHGAEFFINKMIYWALPRDSYLGGVVGKHNMNTKGKMNYIFFRYVQGTVYRFMLRKVNLFIVNSKYMQKQIHKQLEPNIVVENGIKLLAYKEIKYSNNLLYVGRIEKYKGVDFAIKAMPKILSKFPATVFSIVGDGPYKEKLVELVKKLGIEKSVKFVGWVDHEKIEKYYEDTCIFIMPSVWPEAFGKTGVEAMSKGRPVIASRVGGIPEWMEDKKSGFLVNPANADEISKNVIKLFSDKKMLFEFSQNSRKRAEIYSIENYAENLEIIFKKIIKKS